MWFSVLLLGLDQGEWERGQLAAILLVDYSPRVSSFWMPVTLTLLWENSFVLISAPSCFCVSSEVMSCSLWEKGCVTGTGSGWYTVIKSANLGSFILFPVFKYNNTSSHHYCQLFWLHYQIKYTVKKPTISREIRLLLMNHKKAVKLCAQFLSIESFNLILHKIVW